MANDPFDYVIVGSGPAGSVLASRLSEDAGCRVVLLEAGGPDRRKECHIPAAFSKLFKTPCDWDLRTARQPRLRDRELYWPRGKMLGGSSSMNAQMWIRGGRADYDLWEQLGNHGWGFQDALRYFRRIERYEDGSSDLHGDSGPLHVERLRDPNPATGAFLRAAREVGIATLDDVNGPVQDGAAMPRVTQHRGRRWSAADAYLRPAMRRGNLEVRTGARATRVLFEGRRAVGVEYVVGGAVHTVRARREVVLAAGAVGSPQLLMMSGVGPMEHLRALGIDVVADLPDVGGNLLDHLAVGTIVSALRPVSLVAAESIPNLLRYLVLGRGMLTSNVAEACAFVRTRPGLDGPDLELIFAPAPFVDHGLVEPAGHGLTIGAVALQPRSVGTVRLRSPSALDAPEIQPGYLTDPEGEDLRVLVEGVKLARRIFRSAPLAGLAGEEIEPAPGVVSDRELAEAIRDQAETLYHPVGTCRMGVDDRAVVDPALRVRGVAGLRVVDASVMPTLIRGHTMAPTYFIAEKGAEMIRAAVSTADVTPIGAVDDRLRSTAS